MNSKITLLMAMAMLFAGMAAAQSKHRRLMPQSPAITMATTVAGAPAKSAANKPVYDCQFMITGYDDFGGGWSGNTVSIMEDGVAIFTYTLESGYVGSAYFGVTNGGHLEAVFEGTNYPYSNAYRIYDSNGNLLFEDGMNGTTPVGGVIGTTICNLTHDISTVSVGLPGLGAPQTFTPKGVFKNRGSETVTFDVTMNIGTEYTSTKTITDLDGGETITVEFDSWTATDGVYETHVCASLTGDILPENDCKDKTVTISGGNIFYAYCVSDLTGTVPEGPVNFLAEDPGTIYPLAPTTSTTALHGGCWVDGMWYGSQLFEINLYRIDEISGEMTSMPTNADMSFNGLAWDGANAKLYGATYNSLYSIDLTTNLSTLIGPMNNTAPMIGIACNRDGVLYGIDMGDNSLYLIDSNTGNATVVGPLGIEICYIQDMAWDLDNDILYLAGYNAITDQGELYTIDPLTGTATLVGPFESGMELAGFAIPTNTITSDLTLDARTTLILSPETGEELGMEKVTAVIKNNGTALINNLPVTYTVNNGAEVTEYIPVLNPGNVMEYTFNTLADLTAQDSTYVITVCTALAGDENTVNNCQSVTITNIAPCLITCPTGASDEQEPCGDDTNGGCNMATPAYGSIQNGETICGTFWFDGNNRDTDWYKFTITEPQNITITANAEYGYAITLADMRGGCENPIVVTGYEFAKCEEGSINIDITEPGEYVAFVGSAFGEPLSCNDHNKYWIKLNIDPYVPGYCTNGLYTDGCIMGDGITALKLNDINLSPVACDGAPTSGYEWYHNWTSLTTGVANGDKLSLKTAYDNTVASAWIDFDDNLLWEADEMVVDNFYVMVADSMVNVPIAIPVGAPAGNHRFRVRTNWDAQVNSPCDSYGYGNAIDFNVDTELNTSTTNLPGQEIQIFPNPATNKLTIRITGEALGNGQRTGTNSATGNSGNRLRMLNALGHLVYENDLTNVTATGSNSGNINGYRTGNTTEIIINTSMMQPGVYILQMEDSDGRCINRKVVITR